MCKTVNLNAMLLSLGELLEKTKLLTCSSIMKKSLQFWYYSGMKMVILTINIIAMSLVSFSATRVEIRPDIGGCLEDKQPRVL